MLTFRALDLRQGSEELETKAHESLFGGQFSLSTLSDKKTNIRFQTQQFPLRHQNNNKHVQNNLLREFCFYPFLLKVIGIKPKRVNDPYCKTCSVRYEKIDIISVSGAFICNQTVVRKFNICSNAFSVVFPPGLRQQTVYTIVVSLVKFT